MCNPPAEIHLFLFEEQKATSETSCLVFPLPQPPSQSEQYYSNITDDFDYANWLPPQVCIQPTGGMPGGMMLPTSASLLICTADGILRYWEDVRTSSAKQFTECKLNNLPIDHHITNLTAIEPNYYLIGTSGGQLFAVQIAMKIGQPVIQQRPISRPVNLLGKMTEWMTSSSQPSSPSAISCALVGQRVKTHQPSLIGVPREVFVINQDCLLSCWALTLDKPEKVLT